MPGPGLCAVLHQTVCSIFSKTQEVTKSTMITFFFNSHQEIDCDISATSCLVLKKINVWSVLFHLKQKKL